MKKILSLILCAMLLLPGGIISNAYSGTEAINILKSMGVLSGDPDGNMRENDLVTRAEFAKMAVLLSEYKNELALSSQVSVFEDCSYRHWAAPYIKTASEHGIIEGYSDGLFRPEQNISYTEAVTIALRLLGYSDSDFGNAYPEPQRAMALSLKLNKGISKSGDEALSRSELAVILSNTLITDKNGGGEYAEALGYTIADDTVLVATNAENPSVAPNKIYTSNGEYYLGSAFDKELLGRKGTAVIHSEGYLLTLLDNGSDTEEYAVYALSGDAVSLYGKKGITSISPDGGTLVYDGITKSTFASVRSKLQTGDIVILSRTAEGNIDYMLLTGSDFSGPYTVTADGIIPADGDYSSYSVLKNSKNIAIEDINKNDIIYISSSLKTVFVYDKKVGGIYSSAAPDSYRPTSVTVGGNEYQLESPLAFAKLALGDISPGDSIVLLLGREGGIADIISDSAANGSDELSASAIDGALPENAAVLSALGAISSPVYDAEGIVTRAEFAKMAVMISQFRNSVATDIRLSIFPDCPYTHWASPYIKTAAENSLMSAYSDSCFYPDNAISLAEAVDCVLKILGYSDSDFGDYPSSQISLASSKSIISGIDKSAYDSITKSEAVTLLYNALLSSCKGSSRRLIESLGFEYYEDVVAIATNSENSSVPSGKLLTSVGTYTISDSFDRSVIGKCGSLLVYSGTLELFNLSDGYMSEGIIYSSVPGGIMLTNGDGYVSVSISDDVIVYVNAQKSSFSSAKLSISAGDSAYISYDENMRLKYIYIDSSDTEGPFVVKSPSAWYSSIRGASEDSTILRGGSRISSDELNINDIIYYIPTLDTAFVYSEKRIGSFENAAPVKDSPENITVSGTSYELEVPSALYSGAQYGDIIVLCLGRDGGVAHSYTLSSTELGACLLSTGVKEFTNSQGDSYTSLYARLALANGTELDIPVESNYDNWIGDTMKISFANGKPKLSVISGGFDISGKADSANMTIGSNKLASDVKIIDVCFDSDNKSPVYKSIYPQRLDGISISKSDILYAKTDGGYINELILKNVTGDAYKYGIITSASANTQGMNSSGSYTCDIGGSSYSYSGGVYNNLKKGVVVRAAMSGSRIDSFTALIPESVRISEIDYINVTLSDGSVYKLSDELVIYRLVGSTEYAMLPISELTENLDSYSYCTIYRDKAESKGGRVRVIVVR